MLKKSLYALALLLLIIMISAIFGIRWFNNLWFEEKPNYLTYSIENESIPFIWAGDSIDGHYEAHSAILIPCYINDIKQPLYFQFDTGTPSTVIYGNTLHSLDPSLLVSDTIMRDESLYLKKVSMKTRNNAVKLNHVKVMENYGPLLIPEDMVVRNKVGSIGADFLDNKVVVINFKNKVIQLYDKRPAWMTNHGEFKSFDFTGRRFMLPAVIAGKELELFYDSGSSAFGLITSKSRYGDFSDPIVEEIRYDAARWGGSLPICHKETKESISIGGQDLPLKRVSYVDMYAPFQKFLSPFTRIGGWLGNKPFTESILVIDTKAEEFIVIKNGINASKLFE